MVKVEPHLSKLGIPELKEPLEGLGFQFSDRETSGYIYQRPFGIIYQSHSGDLYQRDAKPPLQRLVLCVRPYEGGVNVFINTQPYNSKYHCSTDKPISMKKVVGFVRGYLKQKGLE